MNADDAEAAVSAIRLAMAFRERFHHDVVVDLVGYRRFGHNEGDEPGYTQPLMYKLIEEHPTVREQYAAGARRARASSRQAEAERLVEEVQTRLRAVHEELKASFGASRPAQGAAGSGAAPTPRSTPPSPPTRLRELNEQLLEVPEGFTVHPKLGKELERRRDALGEEGGIDWAQAEALAFGSLLADGTPVRLTGQDTERGTFSHRHLVLHDYETGEKYAPIQHLPDSRVALPGVQLAALGDGGARLRVRLLGRRPRARSSSGRRSSATSSTRRR